MAGYVLPHTSPIKLTDIECTICLGVVVRPLQLPCGQMSCTACLCAWVKHTVTLDPLLCPCCPLAHSITVDQLHPVPPVMTKLLDTVLVQCKRCQQTVAGSHHLVHLESGCKTYVHTTSSDGPKPAAALAPMANQQIMTLPTGGRVRNV